MLNNCGVVTRLSRAAGLRDAQSVRAGRKCFLVFIGRPLLSIHYAVLQDLCNESRGRMRIPFAVKVG